MSLILSFWATENDINRDAPLKCCYVLSFYDVFNIPRYQERKELAVGIITTLRRERLRNCLSISGSAKGLSVLQNVYIAFGILSLGLKWPGRETDLSSALIVVVKNAWSYPFAFPRGLCLHGIHKNNFYLLPEEDSVV